MISICLHAVPLKTMGPGQEKHTIRRLCGPATRLLSRSPVARPRAIIKRDIRAERALSTLHSRTQAHTNTNTHSVESLRGDEAVKSGKTRHEMSRGGREGVAGPELRTWHSTECQACFLFPVVTWSYIFYMLIFASCFFLTLFLDSVFSNCI